MTISWNPVSGAVGYYIFETNWHGDNPSFVGETKAGTYYKTLTGLDSGYHYYQVRAYAIVNNQSYYSSLSGVTSGYVSYYNTNISNVVYITNTGSKYHRYGCQYLRYSCIPISLSSALARGYSACSVCW